MIRIIILLLTAVIAHASLAAENNTPTRLELRFANNSPILMRDYAQNKRTLEILDSILTDPLTMDRVDSIVIEAASSMPGSIALNRNLSQKRAEELEKYIKTKTITKRKLNIKTSWEIVDWATLEYLIRADSNAQKRNEIIKILENQTDDQIIINQLNKLAQGRGLNLIRKYEKQMRRASCLVFYLSPPNPMRKPSTMIAKRPLFGGDSIQKLNIIPKKTILKPNETVGEINRPLFAVKTNLLYDAATALNIAVEVPVGKRWSIAAEWIFPWWHNHKKHYHFQILSGNLEAKYWFKPLRSQNGRSTLLTGWFAGAYLGGGVYDLEYNAKGYQGEAFFSAGIMAGYAHPVAKCLRMEYSIGMGYMNTQFRRYNTLKLQDNMWHRIRMESQTLSWVGPTHLKISLVWMINYKKSFSRITIKD